MLEGFPCRDGELCAEGVPLAAIAASVGTPFYVYSAGAIGARYRRFAAAFAPEAPLICFAVKANSNLAVLRLFARLGAGADVVSEGELRRALAAGIAPDRIVFSGVGKTRGELDAALAAGIRQMNVESLPELHLLSKVAQARGRVAPVAIRVNPDVDALTHAKIATGKRGSKFGIDIEDAAAAYRLADELPGIAPVGLAVHIGSQTGGGLDPFRAAFERLAALVVELRQAGMSVARVDLGGGLGIRYHTETPPSVEGYAALVRDVFGALDVHIAFEPGRVLVGPAGLLIARVICVKDDMTKRVIVLDAAMNDLIRPALYDAWHDIVPVRLPAPGAVLRAADVVGPVCETADTFAAARDLPPLAAGDLVALTDAGAYGAVMSSTYNSRLLVPEVLAASGRFAIVRPRPSYEELLKADTVPEWIGDAIAEPASTPARGAA
ncbi:MAG TPA: diaminopimelate decarboxylase [Stellaceae bacterium]|nr:diaminopimelate decarboxylase [Stellaceae bacterium]